MTTEAMDALIVRNLQDLKRADQRLRETIQPEIGKEIDKIINKWARKNDWYSYEAFEEAVGSHIAPEKWRRQDDDASEDEFYATFNADAEDAGKDDEDFWLEADHYWLAQLCGLANGALGFRWECDFKSLGVTKKKWKDFLEEIEAPLNVKGFGFEYQDKSGAFFIPYRIDHEKLAEAIAGNNIEDALQPVDDALGRILASWEQFDAILEKAKKQFK